MYILNASCSVGNKQEKTVYVRIFPALEKERSKKRSLSRNNDILSCRSAHPTASSNCIPWHKGGGGARKETENERKRNKWRVMTVLLRSSGEGGWRWVRLMAWARLLMVLARVLWRVGSGSPYCYVWDCEKVRGGEKNGRKICERSSWLERRQEGKLNDDTSATVVLLLTRFCRF